MVATQQTITTSMVEAPAVLLLVLTTMVVTRQTTTTSTEDMLVVLQHVRTIVVVTQRITTMHTEAASALALIGKLFYRIS